MRFLICLLAIAVLIPATMVAANPPADLEARRKALNDLLHDRWEYTMRTSPIYASILGDKRFNDQIDDFSQAAIDDDLEQTRVYLKRFGAIDTAGFPEQEALNKALGKEASYPGGPMPEPSSTTALALRKTPIKVRLEPVTDGDGKAVGDNYFKLKDSFTDRVQQLQRKIVEQKASKAEMKEIDGILYCNDGDWVESCTALVEHRDGRLEIIEWAATRQFSMLAPNDLTLTAVR